jgi:RHS repeat-associated protein
VYKPGEEVSGALEIGITAGRHRVGVRSYELNDHLGNVRVVFSDWKKPGFKSVEAAYEYYPFGMMLQKLESQVYRFGFNGKENDDETGWQDYGMRMYNPNLARFFRVDPITSKYPELTPYQFASNCPVLGVDLDGKEFLLPSLANTHPIMKAFNKGVVNTLTGTLNFIVHDAYQSETWENAGMYMEEVILSSASHSNIYKPSTPRLDAQVNNLKTKVIEGDALSIAEFIGELGTEIVTGILVDKGVGRMKSLVVTGSMTLFEKIATRQCLAKSFLKKSGVGDIERHMSAISFDDPVYTSTLKKGDKVYRFSIDGDNGPKHYFTTEKDFLPGEVGKNSYRNRTDVIIEEFTLNEDVKVLNSTIDMKDGTKGKSQIFSTEIQNASTVKQGKSWADFEKK